MTSSSGDSISLTLPPALLAEVEAAADALQDVIERGLEERRWQRTLAKGQAHAKALGFTEEDVPRLIAEFRKEQRQGRTVFRTENLSAAELEAITEGGMDARHHHLNAELPEPASAAD